MKKKTKTMTSPPFLYNQPFPLPLITHRTEQKLIFLTHENTDLKNRLQSTQNLLKQKDDLLKQTLLEDLAKNSSAKISTNDLSKNPRIKDPYIVLEGLFSENRKLYEILEQVSKEKDQAITRSFLTEQVLEDLQRREGETLDEYNRKLAKLTKLIEEKDKLNQDLAKVKNSSLIKESGILPEEKEENFIYRYVLEPNEQVLAINEELEILKGILQRVLKEIRDLKVKNKDLVQINYVN